MKKRNAIIWLLVIFVIVLIIKFAGLYFFVNAPSAFSDEYAYMKVARSLHFHQGFSIHGEPYYKYPPLYPMLMSLAYYGGQTKGMIEIYSIMKIMNAIIGALIIFPAYWLSREFFKRRQSLWIALLVAVVPSFMVLMTYVMSENLFFPLFLCTVYFAYKSWLGHEWRWGFLAGLFMGLCMLTRAIMLPFILALGMMWLFDKGRYRDNFWNLFRIGVVFLLVVLPWYLNDKVMNNASYLASATYGLDSYLTLLTLPFVYLAYLMFASAVVPFFTIFPHPTQGRKKYFWRLAFFTIISFVIFLGVRQMYFNGYTPSIFPWVVERPIGRYVACLIPLVLMMGFVGYKNNGYREGTTESKKVKLKIWLMIALLFACGIFLLSFSMFPPNNSDLTLIGGYKMIWSELFKNSTYVTPLFGSDSIPIILGISLLLFYIFVAYTIRELLLREVVIVMVIFFLIVSLAGLMAANYSASQWYNGEAMYFGRWVNANVPPEATILMDERDCGGTINKMDQTLICEAINPTVSFPSTIMGVWMNNDLYIGDVNSLNIPKDYIITRHNLIDMGLGEPIHESSGGIKIYKV